MVFQALKDRIDEHIRNNRMFQGYKTVYTAVSGGMDSVFLFHILQAILGPGKIHVVHINHGLRGPESDADENFVKSLAARYGIPVTTRRIDVCARARQNKESLEEAGRMARLETFFDLISPGGEACFALGHHRDDFAETILMRLLRGTGPYGIGRACEDEVNFRRENKMCRLVRPLSILNRNEIEKTVVEQGWSFCHDKTNDSPEYTRNLIRLELIPLLKEKFGKKSKEAILRFGMLAREESRVLEKLLREKLCQATSRANDELIFDLKAIEGMDEDVGRVLVRQGLLSYQGELEGWTRRHFREIDKLIKTRHPSAELSLGKGVVARKVYDKLIITNRGFPKKEGSFEFTHHFPCRELFLPAIALRLKIDLSDNDVFPDASFRRTNGWTAYLDARAFGGEIKIRSRKCGDKFWPLGQEKEGKLKTFFISQKVPLFERPAWPLLESGGRIIWAMGLRISETAKITPETRKVIKIEVSRDGEKC